VPVRPGFHQVKAEAADAAPSAAGLGRIERSQVTPRQIAVIL
jgi:hypothetical protein